MEVARFLVLPVIVVLPLEATHKETQMHVDADCGAVAGADSDFGSTDLMTSKGITCNSGAILI